MLKNSSIEKIKSVNEAAKQYFFSKGAMKFFNSRVITNTNKYGIFITSEKNNNYPRYYTLRFISSSGNVYTIGKFQNYVSLYYAKKERDKLEKIFDELTKCHLENEVLQNITAIYEAHDYPHCIEIYNENKGMIFNLENFTVSGFLDK